MFRLQAFMVVGCASSRMVLVAWTVLACWIGAMYADISKARISENGRTLFTGLRERHCVVEGRPYHRSTASLLPWPLPSSWSPSLDSGHRQDCWNIAVGSQRSL